jgi:hypothetical protein
LASTILTKSRVRNLLVSSRYWFEFVRGGQPTALSLGCGITSYNLDDAKRMLRQEIFPPYGERAIMRVIEGVEVASLDERVPQRLGDPAVRGVWFPVTSARRPGNPAGEHFRSVAAQQS